MDLWFLTKPQILTRERAALKQLQDSAPWLSGCEWTLEQQLTIKAVINVQGHDYKVRLVYPSHFPEVPPAIFPQESSDRWSTHQYPTSGALCLEWGPDNWVATVTGADMLESAYRLLEHENPTGSAQENKITAPSRHYVEIGAMFRHQSFRAFFSAELPGIFSQLSGQKAFKFYLNFNSCSLIAIISELKSESGEVIWKENIPPIAADDIKEGSLFVEDIDESFLSDAKSFQQLKVNLEKENISTQLRELLSGEQKPLFILILDKFKRPHLIFSFNRETLAYFKPMFEPDRKPRNPTNLTVLKDKSVAIVGIGSVGSKMAVSLARAGINKFALIDYDIFFPANIDRNALDWRNVGEHKAEAVKQLILNIRPGSAVETANINLTGQESAAFVNRALNQIANYDLIIDATANDRAFNILASVAQSSGKDLVWSEVYAGGRGGLVARCRAGIDPTPLIMRASFNQFCVANPAPEEKVIDYGAEGEKEIVMASDSDVGIIAENACRLAIDTLIRRDVSEYPYSLYLIGLSKWWVFEAPLHVIPIDLTSFQSVEANPDEEMSEENKKFIAGLIDENPSPE